MGWFALGAAAIGAAGSIGGALLSSDGSSTPGAQKGALPGQDTTPGLKVAEFNNLLAYGVFDPSPLLQAGPVGTLISEMSSSGQFGNIPKANLTHNLRLALDWYAAGQPQPTRGKGPDGVADFPGVTFNKGVPEFRGAPIDSLTGLLDHILQFSGYGSLDDLIGAETAYKKQIQPLLASAEAAAAGNFQANLDVQKQVNTLLANLPDSTAQGIERAKSAEKTRLLRDLNFNIDEQRGDLLETANFGNFNPGRPLGDLEEFRARATQDADLEALSRALSLIGGQQTLAGNNLSQLYGGQNQLFNQATQIAAADQGLQRAELMAAPNLQQPAQGALGSGISSAASGFGDALLYYGQSKQADTNQWLADHPGPS